MSVLLTNKYKLSSSNVDGRTAVTSSRSSSNIDGRTTVTSSCTPSNVDGRTAVASSRSEVVLRSYSISSHQSCNDGDGKQRGSNTPWMSVIRETSVMPDNGAPKNADNVVTPVSNTWLKWIKRPYKYLHLNYLFSLAFMMIYMFLGALLFLWLEGASDQARKLHEYKFYIRQRELFLEQLDEIYHVEASQQRKILLKKAIDYLHRQIGVSFSNRSEWSLTTAMYYSGTVLTTIGLFWFYY
ncbi:unnamed protein product [Cercopithifilaria johnstoni]|uniref:Uncharacterized protein n=1 Tax=Cercopithifilaria johnstoni TaxID=2874296 RepID=A0A8J2MUR8_9BILA|nr:unnamed protein product [Cercopithifilaria johnstoni]